MSDLHDTYEQRGHAYEVLEQLTAVDRDAVRRRLTALGDVCDTIVITASDGTTGVELSIAAVRTVLFGNDDERYLALFPNHWGRGKSVVAAIAAARKHGARGRDYYVMKMPAGTYGAHVSDMLGRWTYFWALDVEQTAGPACVATSGDARGKMALTAEA